MSREITSPSPRPFGLVVEKGVNRVRRVALDRPGPLSVTAMTTRSSVVETSSTIRASA
ncbi:hypothetical protein D3C80_2176660 [compost metagenome]